MKTKFYWNAAFVAVIALAAGRCPAADVKVKAEDLPKKVMDSLHARFAGLEIVSAAKESEADKTIYDIELTQKGSKFETDIQDDGTMLEVEKQIAEKQWSKALISAVKAEHPHGTIKEIMEVFKVTGKEEVADHFEVTVETAKDQSSELLFSLDGKPMKEEVAKEADAAADEDIKFDELPAAVKGALHSKFPKAEMGAAEKGTEDGQAIYEISIKNDGHNIDVTLTPDGKILSFEKTLSKSDLPKATLDALDAKYPHATVKLAEEVWEHDKLTGYEATIVTTDKETVEVTFDPKGKLVEDKEEK